MSTRRLYNTIPENGQADQTSLLNFPLFDKDDNTNWKANIHSLVQDTWQRVRRSGIL